MKFTELKNIRYRENPLFWHYLFYLFWIPVIFVTDTKQTITLIHCDLAELLKIAILLMMILSFILNLKKYFSAWYCLLAAYVSIFPLIFMTDMHQTGRGNPYIAFAGVVVLGVHSLIVKRTPYLEYLEPKEYRDDSETEGI